ncbi:MAG: BatD family protein [Flavobacteriales bacterium]
MLDTPDLDFPNDFESYDPKVTDRISVNSGGMSGSRSYQFLLIPRHEGSFPLEPIRFSYFDTRTNAYRTIEADPIQFDVSAGDGTAITTIQRPNKSDVEVLGKDIRYIRTGDMHLEPAGDHLFGSLPWIAGMGAPALAFVLFAAWRRKRLHDEQDELGMRRKHADRVVRKRLSEAEKALKGNDRNAFYTALGKALHGYITDKFGLGQAETTGAHIAERFEQYENGSTVAKEYVALMEAADMARYAPVEDRPRQQLYDDAASLIRRTEQLVRS